MKFPYWHLPDYHAAEIQNLTFPLREITGFAAFINMDYVDSLGKMFPQLAGKPPLVHSQKKPRKM